MSSIVKILSLPSRGGYYYDDLAALQEKGIAPQDRYTAKPITPGFQRVREPAESLTVGLVLGNGIIAWGECTSVSYGGTAGRDPVFRSRAGLESIRNSLEPLLIGQNITDYLHLAQEIESVTETVEVERVLSKREPGEEISRRELFKSTGRMLRGKPDREKVSVQQPLHSAVLYGVSQALFQAAALQRGVTITELICQDWGLPLPDKMVSIHAQCGSNRYRGAEKMIVRGLLSLPHGLVDHLDDQLGKDAIRLIRYIKWLKRRIRRLGSRGYQPTIHLDLHGGLGKLYENNLGKILGAITSLEKAAQPYPLRLESPLLMDSREDQIQALKTLREYLQFRKMRTKLVADEWAETLADIKAHLEGRAADMIHVKMPDLGGIQNSIDAVLACKSAQTGVLLGGSCVETDLTARISAQLALAVQPDLILAKPGLGVDEGISIINNQMVRTLATIQQGDTG